MHKIRIFKISLLALGLFQTLSKAAPEPMPVFEQNNHILFQGDSITDGNRGRSADPNHILGHGYAFLIAAKYGAALAERNLTFLNRGISGNKVSDLAGRWQGDTLGLKPDILSILIGVNDASANVSAEQYEKTYDQILQQVIAANPDVRLVLMEPFTLLGAKHQDDWETWRANIQGKQDAVARLAAKYGAALVHCQQAFDEAAKRAPAEYWIWDTIHPTYSGHQLLADAWIKAVGEFKFAPHPKIEIATNPVAAPVNNPTPVTNLAPETKNPTQGAFSFASAHASDNKKSIVLGWKFITDNALDVSALGYFNDGANTTHSVGIFDATTKTLVAPALPVATIGGALSGDNATFTFVQAPQLIHLAANTTYIIAATTSGTGWLEKAKNFTLAYGINPASVHCVYKFEPEELVFPDSSNAGNDPVFLGPNFLASIAP